MRDIGARIQRYRLSRYGAASPSLLRSLRWIWPILGLWLAYVTFFSEHSLFRIWRMGREDASLRAELDATRHELSRLETQMKDPRVRRDQAEHLLRERSGFAKPGEIIYRVPSQDADSLAR
jgi:cell division protein FtsB